MRDGVINKIERKQEFQNKNKQNHNIELNESQNLISSGGICTDLFPFC